MRWGKQLEGAPPRVYLNGIDIEITLRSKISYVRFLELSFAKSQMRLKGCFFIFESIASLGRALSIRKRMLPKSFNFFLCFSVWEFKTHLTMKKYSRRRIIFKLRSTENVLLLSNSENVHSEVWEQMAVRKSG